MVATVLVRMFLKVQVRKSVSTTIFTHWLSSRAYLSLDRNAKGAETPEFRMADDVRLAIDQLVDLAVGFFTSVILAITFFEVLARVGGSIRLDALGVTIPAYFLVAAVLYAMMLSGLTSIVGWPLVGRIQRKNHLEGVFRYELMRVRENARQIADERQEHREHGHLSRAMEDLVQQWRRVLVGQAQVSGVASSNAVLVGMVPVILAIPKYMTGEMTLGAVMQLATAFVQVLMALNWIVDNFIRVAELRASANRVGELVAAMDRHDDAAIPAASAHRRRIARRRPSCGLNRERHRLPRARRLRRRSRRRAGRGRARSAWAAGDRGGAGAGGGVGGQRLARSAADSDRLDRRRGDEVARDPAQLGALRARPPPPRGADR